MTTTTAQLGTSVVYTNGKGTPKAALVIGTPESLNPKAPSAEEAEVLAKYGYSTPSHSAVTLHDGQVVLQVWEVRGVSSANSYTRVAEFDAETGTYRRANLSAATAPSVDDEDSDEDSDTAF